MAFRAEKLEYRDALALMPLKKIMLNYVKLRIFLSNKPLNVLLLPLPPDFPFLQDLVKCLEYQDTFLCVPLTF